MARGGVVRTVGSQGSVEAGSVVAIGVVLVLLQAADGVLTSLGIAKYGFAAEGNPFLRHLMEQFGHIPTLAALKLAAIIVVIGLTLMAKRLPWIKNALGAISCIYLFAAILPWTYILYIQPN